MEINQSQTRKRKDRKKKGKDSIDRRNEDDEDSIKTQKVSKDEFEDDTDEYVDEGHGHGHGHGGGGVISTAVFIILLSGLVIVTALIYIELKDSKDVGPTITESRYASYLGEFVEEPGSRLDEHGEEDEEHLQHYEAENHEDDAHDEEAESHEEDLHGEEAEDHEEDLHGQETETHEEELHGEETIEHEDSTERNEIEPDVHSEDKLEPDTREMDVNEEKSNEDNTPNDFLVEPKEDIDREDLVKDAEQIDVIQNDENEVVVDHTSTQTPPVEYSTSSADSSEPTSDVDTQETEEKVENEERNDYDREIEEELQLADKETEKSLERALLMYEDILTRHPLSPRATYGRASCLDRLSEQKKSNTLLDESIHVYTQFLQLPDLPDSLFRTAADRCADRMKFRGYTSKAAGVERMLLRKFPDDISIQNSLAVTYLQLGKNEEAKSVLDDVLKRWPTNGFAKVHYGFIMKSENNLKQAIKYLSEGIATEEEGTVDGRFYFHLGDALSREGNVQQAYKVYKDGVDKGLFRSVYQRSLYNEDNLTGRPWWTPEQTTYLQHLQLIESQWQKIRDEAVNLLDDKKESFLPESEGLRDTGVWKQFEIFSRGNTGPIIARAPFTCQLMENITSASSCTRGQIKFSVMHPQTHVWAHTGPTNCRLRAHLGLVVPEGARIRVANETRSWTEGRFLIFDDSFEHEVWHDGNSSRVILIIDFWHPELTQHQRRTLTPI